MVRQAALGAVSTTFEVVIPTMLLTMELFSHPAGSAGAVSVRVTVTNNAAAGGIYLTPMWIGFHDGGFDLFDIGGAASAGCSRHCRMSITL